MSNLPSSNLYKGIQITASSETLLRSAKKTLCSLAKKWPSEMPIAMILCDDNMWCTLIPDFYPLVSESVYACKIALRSCNIAIREEETKTLKINKTDENKNPNTESKFFSNESIENLPNPIIEVLEKNKENIRREFKRVGYYVLSDYPRTNSDDEQCITEWFVNKGMDRNHFRVLCSDDGFWRLVYSSEPETPHKVTLVGFQTVERLDNRSPTVEQDALPEGVVMSHVMLAAIDSSHGELFVHQRGVGFFKICQGNADEPIDRQKTDLLSVESTDVLKVLLPIAERRLSLLQRYQEVYIYVPRQYLPLVAEQKSS